MIVSFASTQDPGPLYFPMSQPQSFLPSPPFRLSTFCSSQASLRLLVSISLPSSLYPVCLAQTVTVGILPFLKLNGMPRPDAQLSTPQLLLGCGTVMLGVGRRNVPNPRAYDCHQSGTIFQGHKIYMANVSSVIKKLEINLKGLMGCSGSHDLHNPTRPIVFQ